MPSPPSSLDADPFETEIFKKRQILVCYCPTKSWLMFSTILANFQLWRNPGQEWTGMSSWQVPWKARPIALNLKVMVFFIRLVTTDPGKKIILSHFSALGSGGWSLSLDSDIRAQQRQGSLSASSHSRNAAPSLMSPITLKWVTAWKPLGLHVPQMLWVKSRANPCGWQGCLSSLITRRELQSESSCD